MCWGCSLLFSTNSFSINNSLLLSLLQREVPWESSVCVGSSHMDVASRTPALLSFPEQL